LDYPTKSENQLTYLKKRVELTDNNYSDKMTNS